MAMLHFAKETNTCDQTCRPRKIDCRYARSVLLDRVELNGRRIWLVCADQMSSKGVSNGTV